MYLHSDGPMVIRYLGSNDESLVGSSPTFYEVAEMVNAFDRGRPLSKCRTSPITILSDEPKLFGYLAFTSSILVANES